ncbi:MAG: protein-(glutamine-N(5)) methyltransferase [Candidatus Westeberhardia cardiocondylae]|nr:protein-(glutamine-N(5)) methyltransferase [Candidatus Westeberhardia cardiocondylae]
MNWDQWIKSAYIRLYKIFKKSYVMREIEILFCKVLQINLSQLIAYSDTVLTNEQLVILESLLHRRENHEPIAYLIGRQEFWSLDLHVSPYTFIPRIDTECLIEQALQLIVLRHAKILDLGTGSGAISLALAVEKPTWKITAVDYCLHALTIAKKNSILLDLKNINFVYSNWFQSLKFQLYHLIISNPPYVSLEEFLCLDKEIYYEPRYAILSENNGLKDLKKICFQANYYLTSGGWLILEHGWNQGKIVRSFFSRAMFCNIITIQDHNKNDRITLGQWK